VVPLTAIVAIPVSTSSAPALLGHLSDEDFAYVDAQIAPNGRMAFPRRTTAGRGHAAYRKSSA
jgi:hypothetical protein